MVQIIDTGRFIIPVSQPDRQFVSRSYYTIVMIGHSQFKLFIFTELAWINSILRRPAWRLAGVGVSAHSFGPDTWTI